MRILRERPSLHYQDNRLRLFFLGVGWAFSRRHFQTNLLIIKGADHLMVDFGTTAPRALEQVAGLSLADVRVLLPTHSHADHIGGLEELALTNRYYSGTARPKMVITEEFERLLWEESLRGGLAHNESLAGNFHSPAQSLTFSDYFEPLRPQPISGAGRESYRVKVGALSLEIFRTRHIPAEVDEVEDCHWSCGLLIDGRIFYSGDTRYDVELIEQYRDAEWFFHDCQLQRGPAHASYVELQELPAVVRKRMFLIHYGDDWERCRPAQDGFHGFAEQGIQYLF